MQYYYSYQTPIGDIWIVEEDNFIVKLKYEIDVKGIKEMETPLIKTTYHQLTEYFNGKRKTFDLPLKLKGTKFQQQVWSALQTIPYGEVWSYKHLAEVIENPRACRAVGNANNHNPVAIIVPCHRVVGIDGELVGYAGGLKIKKQLLDIEQNEITEVIRIIDIY